MRDALALVKEELGPNAVILGTRMIPAPGLARFAGREQAEITAAPAAHPAPNQTEASSNARTAAAPSPHLDHYTPDSPPAPLPPMSPDVVSIEAHPSDEQPAVPAAAPHSRRAAPAGQQPFTTAALAGLGEAPADIPPGVLAHYTRLVQNEVAAELAARVVRAAVAAIPPGMLDQPAAVEKVFRRCLSHLLPTAPETAPEGGETRRIALVGPPGAGKTTTLAKLAAQFSLRSRKRVAILSLDMNRPGATEQLSRYAEIIQAPLFSAQTDDGVRDVLRTLPPVDFLLIDTPGVGPRENGRFARLRALLRAARAHETHLVLPAGLAIKTQKLISNAFSIVGPERLVLTHLDEAIGFGVILNAVSQLPQKLSYLCAGQNVPKDLERACSKRIAELIFPV